MEDNKNNQNAQNQNNGTDQTGANNSGNGGNTQQNNQNQQQSQQNSQQQNNQSIGGTGAKTFTQEQVNYMMANEKNQGRNAAFREMGIDPNDPNGINMMNMFKAFMSAIQSPEQQVKNQVNQQQSKIIEAENRAIKAEVKAEAMQLGIQGQYVDDAVIIIMSKLNNNTDVKTTVGELKTKYPIWFDTGNNQGTNNNGGNNQQRQNNNQSGQRGTGSSVGNISGGRSQNNGASGLGARLAAQRKSSNSKKSSFWD